MNFSNETQVRRIVKDWLERQGIKAREGVVITSDGGNRIEVDILSRGPDIFNRRGGISIYAIEVKLAYTRLLAVDAAQEAILRLSIADYVLIAAPKEVEIWTSGKEKARVQPPELLRRVLQGRYGRKIGILAVSNDDVEIVRKPQRSSMAIAKSKAMEVFQENQGNILNYITKTNKSR